VKIFFSHPDERNETVWILSNDEKRSRSDGEVILSPLLILRKN